MPALSRCPASVHANRLHGGSRGYRHRVARIVVVASSQLGRAVLSEVVSPDDELYVVVPAVEQSRLQWLANDDDAALSEARDVGESIGRAAPTAPSGVEVTPDTPDQAVLDAIAVHRPDRIVVALREDEEATWLEAGGLDELPREIDGIPVVRVTI